MRCLDEPCLQRTLLPTLAAVVLLTAPPAFAPLLYLSQNLPTGSVAPGAAKWGVATFGPLALSVWCWRVAPTPAA